MRWQLLAWELDGDTVFAGFSDGTALITVLADVTALTEDEAAFARAHITGPGPNTVGPRVRSLADYIKEFLHVRRLRIEGAPRTSGAAPGRVPPPIVF